MHADVHVGDGVVAEHVVLRLAIVAGNVRFVASHVGVQTVWGGGSKKARAGHERFVLQTKMIGWWGDKNCGFLFKTDKFGTFAELYKYALHK